MKKFDLLSYVLGIVGTALIWFPLLAPVVLGLTTLIYDGIFRFDYLIPMEVFPSVLLGGILLVWAARRLHSHLPLLGWSFGIAVALFFGTQLLAVVTGLASGENEAVGWRVWLVMSGLVGYILALLVMAAGGLLLIRDLRLRSRA